MYLSIYLYFSLTLAHTQTNKQTQTCALSRTHTQRIRTPRTMFFFRAPVRQLVQQMGAPHDAARRSNRISTPRTPKRTLNGNESMIISPVNAAKKEKHKLKKSLRKGWLHYYKWIVGLVDRLTDRTVFVRVWMALLAPLGGFSQTILCFHETPTWQM